jgi:hypothetical protein
MKKMFFLLTALCFTVSACAAFATPQPQAVAPAPPSDTDRQATVAMSVQQTLQSLPTSTLAPSNTPMVMTATSTPTQPTPTSTQNPALLTLTATLGTGTVTVTAGATGTLPFTATPSLAVGVNPTETNHYQYYGTMPPNLPFGNITLINMSKRDAYISLQCTTKDGYVTIIEYPVGGSRISTKAPAGKYVYVASVGGKKSTGSFKLDQLQDMKIIIYKDRIEIK